MTNKCVSTLFPLFQKAAQGFLQKSFVIVLLLTIFENVKKNLFPLVSVYIPLENVLGCVNKLIFFSLDGKIKSFQGNETVNQSQDFFLLQKINFPRLHRKITGRDKTRNIIKLRMQEKSCSINFKHNYFDVYFEKQKFFFQTRKMEN